MAPQQGRFQHSYANTPPDHHRVAAPQGSNHTDGRENVYRPNPTVGDLANIPGLIPAIQHLMSLQTRPPGPGFPGMGRPNEGPYGGDPRFRGPPPNRPMHDPRGPHGPRGPNMDPRPPQFFHHHRRPEGSYRPHGPPGAHPNHRPNHHEQDHKKSNSGGPHAGPPKQGPRKRPAQPVQKPGPPRYDNNRNKAAPAKEAHPNRANPRVNRPKPAQAKTPRVHKEATTSAPKARAQPARPLPKHKHPKQAPKNNQNIPKQATGGSSATRPEPTGVQTPFSIALKQCFQVLQLLHHIKILSASDSEGPVSAPPFLLDKAKQFAALIHPCKPSEGILAHILNCSLKWARSISQILIDYYQAEVQELLIKIVKSSTNFNLNEAKTIRAITIHRIKRKRGKKFDEGICDAFFDQVGSAVLKEHDLQNALQHSRHKLKVKTKAGRRNDSAPSTTTKNNQVVPQNKAPGHVTIAVPLNANIILSNRFDPLMEDIRSDKISRPLAPGSPEATEEHAAKRPKKHTNRQATPGSPAVVGPMIDLTLSVDTGTHAAGIQANGQPISTPTPEPTSTPTTPACSTSTAVQVEAEVSSNTHTHESNPPPPEPGHSTPVPDPTGARDSPSRKTTPGLPCSAPTTKGQLTPKVTGNTANTPSTTPSGHHPPSTSPGCSTSAPIQETIKGDNRLPPTQSLAVKISIYTPDPPSTADAPNPESRVPNTPEEDAVASTPDAGTPQREDNPRANPLPNPDTPGGTLGISDTGTVPCSPEPIHLRLSPDPESSVLRLRLDHDAIDSFGVPDDWSTCPLLLNSPERNTLPDQSTWPAPAKGETPKRKRNKAEKTPPYSPALTKRKGKEGIISPQPRRRHTPSRHGPKVNRSLNLAQAGALGSNDMGGQPDSDKLSASAPPTSYADILKTPSPPHTQPIRAPSSKKTGLKPLPQNFNSKIGRLNLIKETVNTMPISDESLGAAEFYSQDTPPPSLSGVITTPDNSFTSTAGRIHQVRQKMPKINRISALPYSSTAERQEHWHIQQPQASTTTLVIGDDSIRNLSKADPDWEFQIFPKCKADNLFRMFLEFMEKEDTPNPLQNLIINVGIYDVCRTQNPNGEELLNTAITVWREATSAFPEAKVYMAGINADLTGLIAQLPAHSHAIRKFNKGLVQAHKRETGFKSIPAHGGSITVIRDNPRIWTDNTARQIIKSWDHFL